MPVSGIVSKGINSTQKRVETFEYILECYSKEGDVLLDMTMRSGSVGIVCSNLKRKFIGVEMCKVMFEKVKERFQREFTGLIVAQNIRNLRRELFSNL